jgi:glycosyltransferase involved in cell wall biosynthesis
LNIKTKNPIKMFLNVNRIKKILIENKIDLVSAESRAPAWSCYFACKKLDIPFITTVHGAYNNGWGIFYLFKKWYNSIMYRGDNIVFVSEYVKAHSLKLFRKFIIKKNKIKNTVVIPRGIDLNIFTPLNINQYRIVKIQEELKIPDDKIVIAFPARFTKLKGHLYFLRVLRFLTLHNQNYVCVMIGDMKKHSSLLRTVQKQIFRYGLSGFIKIHDNINDMTALYALSSIVISSSIKPESFGRVSIETQSMGKIFVGTALGGTLETVQDGKTGFLAPYSDERVFAKVLLQIMNMSEEERAAIGENGIENGKKYSLEVMYGKTVEFYRSIFEGQ